MEAESYKNDEEEASRKRPLEDTANGREHKRFNSGEYLPLLKLLVPNYAAGALIGKGGVNITELQTRFGGNIRLSGGNEYYPGTVERIIVITGQVKQLIDINYHIMEKVHLEDNHDNHDNSENHRIKEEGREDQVKIILTNAAAGLLIGRGGVTIKAMQEDTDAKINITKREESGFPGERLLTITGSMQHRIEASQQVIEKIAEEPSNMRNNSLKYGNAVMDTFQGGSFFKNKQQDSNKPISSVSSFGMSGLPCQSFTSKFKANVEILVEVPDNLVDAILGKQDQTIHEFIQFSGAKLKFSDEDEFSPGTTDRILTITGDMKQTETAYFLITQKVEQVEDQLNSQY